MEVRTACEAWKAAYEIADPGTYELDKESEERAGYKIFRAQENFYSRICDLGCRLEVVRADGSSVNVWIKATVEEKKPAPHYVAVHYTEERGNSQHALQRMAADILNYGKRIGETRHVSQEFSPDGSTRTIPTGTYCIEVLNELTGTRYWVHMSGCRVEEIIEYYTAQ